jgi:hypothetical protein
MTMTNGEAREALRSAQGNLAAAEVALNAARATTGRAREILEAIIRESERLDATERRAAEVIEDQMRASLMSGAAPSVSASDRDTAKNAAARAAIDVRRAAAERVVAEFLAAEHEAAEAVEQAQAAVARAIKAVMRAEASALAARWAAVDEEARILRSRLGRVYGPVSQLGALDDQVSKAIAANDDDTVNLEETAAVTDVWNSFAASLARDSEARIDFLPVDHAREEVRAARERVHVSTEDIVAQMRTWTPQPVEGFAADVEWAQ